MLNSKDEVIPFQNLKNAEVEENSNLNKNDFNSEGKNNNKVINQNLSSPARTSSVKFKENEEKESEPILNFQGNENISNAKKIKDILNKAKILNTNSEKNFDLKSSSPLKTNQKFMLKTTPPQTPEREQVFNMIELSNHSESLNNNIYESPNMIKKSFKINSNIKNQKNAIDFIQEKNISNTTFRAGSEVNKNK